MNDNANTRRSCLMLISSLVIVGTIGAFRRYIPLSSPMLAFFRGLVGAACLLLFTALRRKGRRQAIPRRKLLGLALNGVFLGLNWILLFEAYNCTTIAKATLCYYLQPTIVLLLSPLVFHERLTPKKLLCAAVALAGMVFVSGVLDADAARPDGLRGILLGLGAACFYALVVMLNKKLDGVDAYDKTIVQLASAAVVLIPYLLLTEGFSALRTLDARAALLLAVVCVVHTGVVYALYFGSMAGLRAQTISVLSYIDPVVALLVSAVFLLEPMSVLSGVGAALILGSAFVSEYEPRSAG